MIFECTNCFNRPANQDKCDKCGWPHVLPVLSHRLSRMDAELISDPLAYSDQDWKQKVAFFAFRCVYCGEAISQGTKETPRQHLLSKDHVISIYRGGVDRLWNIVPCCVRCNQLKLQKTAYEFMAERVGLCKWALQRQRNQQELFLIRKGFADDKQIPERPALFWVNRRRELANQVLTLSQSRAADLAKAISYDSKKGVQHVLSTSKSNLA